MLPSSRLSLATKTSWKNDVEGWESRIEWHRCVAFGKLADFPGTLSKGLTSPSTANCAATNSSAKSLSARQKTSIAQRVWEILADTPRSSSTTLLSANRMMTTTGKCPAVGSAPNQISYCLHTTVYHYFRAWKNSGVWTCIQRAIYEETRAQAGRWECPSVVIMDGQSVKTTERGGVRRLRCAQAGERTQAPHPRGYLGTADRDPCGTGWHVGSSCWRSSAGWLGPAIPANSDRDRRCRP
jgi:hypothetical protein